MPTGYNIPSPKFRAFDVNGLPLAGGKLTSYAGGTSTPLTTYSDGACTVPNTNPVILDAAGQATVFIPAGVTYKFLLQDASNVTQTGWPVDLVQVANPTAAVTPSPVPTGAILPFGGDTAPTGFLMCDGSAVSRTTYAALFAVLGSFWGGGDGVNTFNVPDMRGRFPLGKAASGTGSTLGGTGGAIDHTHTGPSHTHGVTLARDGWGGVLNVTGVAGRLVTGTGGTNVEQATTDVAATTAAGGTGATGTANPPYAAANFIVKT